MPTSSALKHLAFLLRLSSSADIARRYFVVNGFDGSLTMLGLATGFRLSESANLETAFWACTGTAVALATSGVSSAYISESAERRRALQDLEGAMAGESLSASAHGRAARLAPFFIALVNGGAPLLLAFAVTLPIWLGLQGIPLPLEPLDTAIAVAFGEIALLGAFLGSISGTHWLWMSLKTLAIAAVTAGIILLIGQ
jgi:predicted membrane protein (TIGR00267 family)